MDTKDRPVTDEELLDLLEGMSERDGELWQQVKEKGLTDDCLHLRLLAAASRIGQEEPDVEALLAAFHAGQSRKRRLRLRRWGLSLVGVAAAVLLLFLWMLPDGNGAGTGKEPLLVFASDSAALRSPVLQTEKAPGVQASADDGADRPAVWVAKGPHELDYHTSANLSAYAKDLPERHSLTVPRGQTFKLILSDGTEVYLNADSRLVYPSRFTGKERSVFLDGEAYFRVAKDAGHPFIVRTQTLQTRVLGTEFNVSGYEGSDTEVTLVEGSVEVSDADRQRTVRIKPGEQASLQTDGGFAVQQVDVSQYIHWREGYFYYDNVTLLDIMKELGRWYNVSVVFCNADAMESRLHFVADRRQDLQHALTLLNRMNKFTITQKADGRVYVE